MREVTVALVCKDYGKLK